MNLNPGKSLVWVAILGLVIFYLYALVAFAYFRDVFVPSKSLYCATLWQCTVTMVRYGLLGDYDEVTFLSKDVICSLCQLQMFLRHTQMNSFVNFVYLSIYQVTFFICITTIGLNIIFGIIVDTFSELRDLKVITVGTNHDIYTSRLLQWTAESDMRDTCFICSRKSYDFEHHAQVLHWCGKCLSQRCVNSAGVQSPRERGTQHVGLHLLPHPLG